MLKIALIRLNRASALRLQQEFTFLLCILSVPLVGYSSQLFNQLSFLTLLLAQMKSRPTLTFIQRWRPSINTQ
jgi:hypothetical protein